jgi:hypothetical protein
MNSLLLWLGRLGGIVGVLLGAYAVVVRLQGMYMAGGFQTGTLLLGSIGAMTFACLCYVASVAERAGR